MERLRPTAVRRRLGKPAFDEFYSHLCGISHPRFSAAHVTGYTVAPKAEGATVPEPVLGLGPFVIDGIPPFRSLWGQLAPCSVS